MRNAILFTLLLLGSLGCATVLSDTLMTRAGYGLHLPPQPARLAHDPASLFLLSSDAAPTRRNFGLIAAATRGGPWTPEKGQFNPCFFNKYKML